MMLPPPTKIITFESQDPAWSYKIEQAEFVRAGDTVAFTVDVTPPTTAASGLDTGAASVRIDFPGLYQGPNEISQMIPAGKNARFTWTMGPASPGRYEGQVWIYNGLSKILLNARTVEMEVRGPEALFQLLLRIVVLAVGAAGLYVLFFLKRAPKF